MNPALSSAEPKPSGMDHLKKVFNMGKSVVKFAFNHAGGIISVASVFGNIGSIITKDFGLALLSSANLGLGAGIGVARINSPIDIKNQRELHARRIDSMKPKRERRKYKGRIEQTYSALGAGATFATCSLALDTLGIISPETLVSGIVIGGVALCAENFNRP